MESSILRDAILRQVGTHEAREPSSYVDDTVIAHTLGIPLAEVQRQIRILKEHGLLEVTAAFGPSYGVRLTPRGELALEPGPPPTNPIGF